MRKLTIHVLCQILFITTLTAQPKESHNIFARQSANMISVAAGFWDGNKDFTPSVPQLSLNYQRLVADFGRWGSVGAGLHMSYLSSRYNRFDNDDWILKDFVVGARATYNYTFVPKHLEAYVGAMAGYRVNKFANPNLAPNQDTNLLSPRKSGFAYSFSVGVRYWFINRLGVTLGTGDGTYMNAGLTTKF